MLPGIDKFLYEILGKEKLSGLAERQRLYYLERIEVHKELPEKAPSRPASSKFKLNCEKSSRSLQTQVQGHYSLKFKFKVITHSNSSLRSLLTQVQVKGHYLFKLKVKVITLSNSSSVSLLTQVQVKGHYLFKFKVIAHSSSRSLLAQTQMQGHYSLKFNVITH